jgi:hypothetical protein
VPAFLLKPIMEQDVEILGLSATKHDAGVKYPGSDCKEKGRARYTVVGCSHPKGQPIRYKSVEAAERDIRNRGLAR